MHPRWKIGLAVAVVASVGMAIALAVVGSRFDEVRLERQNLEFEYTELEDEADALRVERDELEQERDTLRTQVDEQLQTIEQLKSELEGSQAQPAAQDEAPAAPAQ
jgi:chromosome segregation ATPase